MYNYKFEYLVIEKIDSFIESYSESFLKLFRDSGITNKYIIEKNYIIKSENLKNEILLSINNIFNKDEIFGYSPITKRKSYIYTEAGNYRIKVFYIENKTKKFRKIYDIEFHYK